MYFPVKRNLDMGRQMGECTDRFVSTFSRDFVLELLGYADSAFAEAEHLSVRYVDEPERSNMLGQLRHARLEAGLRGAATKHGFRVGSPHTNPKGGRYSVVSAGEITLIRGNVQTHRGPPRATKFRRQIAETNRWLSPLQPDFYLDIPDPSSQQLCAVLITAARKRGDQSVPGWVGIGFPHHDLSSWAEIKSLSEIISLYHDAATPIVRETLVTVKDRAHPKLKNDDRSR